MTINLEKFGYWLINVLYWLVGTRVEIEDIYRDVNSISEVFSEYTSILKTHEITKFKNEKVKELSKRRLIALSMRAFEFIMGSEYSWPMNTPNIDYIQMFKDAILDNMNIKVELYEFEYTTEDEVVEGYVHCKDPKLNDYLLLCQFLIDRLNKIRKKK